MNVIFLTLSNINGIKERGIYTDLIRTFTQKGHNFYIISPTERRFNTKTSFLQKDGANILKVKTLNIQKTSVVEKGIGTLLIEQQYIAAIKKYLNNNQFDLILYSTPPITFTNVVKYLKKRNPNAIRYLLLKDIFPQNAVDIGMFGKKSLFYWYFRRKEIELYKNSDFIGCMSPANVNFIHENNPFYPYENIEIAPNSIELSKNLNKFNKSTIREKYHLPHHKIIFIYGGNLGKPQGIDFLIKCLDSNKKRSDCHFIVVGNGTDYHKIDNWYQQNNNLNVTLLQRLPKEEYDLLVQSCDVGLIFLDYRFTIPNYPSRLLAYLENKMPIICATDPNTDIGKIAELNGYGFWCESSNVQNFNLLVNKFIDNPHIVKVMGEKGYDYLCQHYLTEHTYQTIMSHFEEKKTNY